MRWARATVRGALAGGATWALVELAAIGWLSLTTASDPVSARAAVEVQSLGDARARFAALLVLELGAIGALVGAAQAALRAFAWDESGLGLRRAIARDMALAAALGAWWIAIRACTQPALLVPALFFDGAVGALVLDASPALVVGIGALAFGALFVLVARRRGLALWFLGAAAVVAFLVGSVPRLHLARRSHGPASRPNVIVLAADSVRPDHLSGLGYARPTTPRLDALLAQGTVFDHTLAALARTTPSWMSILSGRYPHTHGVRHMFPRREVRASAIPTLPRLLAARGYRTEVLADYAGDFFPIFDLGFERARVPPPLDLATVFEREIVSRSPLTLAALGPLPEPLRPAIFRYLMNGSDPDRMADEVIDRLDASDPRPFFLVAFFSATHVPFAAPYPAYRRFTRPDYRGEHRFDYDLDALADLRRADDALAPPDREQVVALYDGALGAVDAAIGRVIDALGKRGLDRDTYVVFLADHGENLFEPGQTTWHGKWFRGGDEANRVALVVRGPSVAAGRRVSDAVSLVDVAPTLAELLSVPFDGADGRSLAPALHGGGLAPRAVFAETGVWLTGGVDPAGIHYPPLGELLELDPRDAGQLVLRARYEDVVVRAKHRAAWLGSKKLVYEPTTGGADVHLYDLATDPAQTRELGPADPSFAPMQQLLREWMEKDPERELDVHGQMVRRHAG